MTDSVTEADGAFVQAVDPFAYQPDFASKIAGLTEGKTASDPAYVFHSNYVELGRGMRQARIKFEGLRAKRGSLQVSVHMMATGENNRLVFVNSARIALSRLILQEGEFVLNFEAFNGCRYALYGSIPGETDGAADALGIRIEGWHEDEDESGFHTEARNTAHGRSAQGTSALISIDPPSLHSPVSQIATLQQIASPSARGWFEELAVSDPGSIDHWSMAYVLQSLQGYGMISAGARGLGIGPGAEAVAGVLRRHGCDVTIGAPGYVQEDQTSPNAFNQLPLGTELVNFDFLWTWDPDGVIADCRLWIKWAHRALAALLPGGFAVLTFGFDPSVGSRRTGDAASPMRIGRAELEQLALILISRKHQVAQMKSMAMFEPLLVDDDPHRSAQGLIIRRALLPE